MYEISDFVDFNQKSVEYCTLSTKKTFQNKHQLIMYNLKNKGRKLGRLHCTGCFSTNFLTRRKT